jgi:glyoxylase I family protein
MNPPTISLPFAVQRIDHVVLRVRDLERSIAFYRALLGCEIVKRRDDLGLVHLRAGVSMIDLVSLDGALGSRGGAAAGDEGRNMDHLCLRIEPFDEAAILTLFEAHGLAHGATAQSNFGAEGAGPSIYFNDPDGNLIELKGPAVSAQVGAGSRSSGPGPRA